jgi:uncharacterized protein
MRETLDDALAEMFGGATGRRAPTPEIAADSTPAAGTATGDSRLPTLLQEARQRYQNAIQAQRELDWARYGEEMRRLGEVLDRISK